MLRAMERHGYVRPLDLSVYEKGLPKKPATPQVMAIQGGRIQKAKQSLNAKGKAAATVGIPASIRRLPKNLLDRVSQLR
ncbi:hypothetical protein Tco_0326636 [Tanacetum coccineum]